MVIAILKDELISAMECLDEEVVLQCAKQLFEEGYDYYAIQELLNIGVQKVGQLFENGVYFIADLIESGMLYKEVLESFYKEMADLSRPTIGKVVVAVMENDIHDIGKNIICSVLRGEGFEVIDLGIDIPPQTIVDHVKAYNPDILALSGVMSSSIEGMKKTVDYLIREGLRSDVAVIVGGTCIDSSSQKQVGADACTKDPMETIAFCKKVVNKNEH